MLDLLIQWKWLIQIVVLAILFIASWRWGAGPEKASITTMIFMIVADWPYHLLVGRRAIVQSIDLGHLFIDGAATLMFVAVALRANRVYPLWLAAFQIVSLISHLTRDLSLAIAGKAYAILIVTPSYFQTAIIICGLIAHLRRTRRFGNYRSWRHSYDHSLERGPKG